MNDNHTYKTTVIDTKTKIMIIMIFDLIFMRLKIERDGDGYERKLKNQKQWPRVYGQQQQFHFVKNVISNRRRRRKKKRIFCGLVVVV